MDNSKKLLLVDDDHSIFESLKEVLKDEYVIQYSETGECAIGEIKKGLPDAILMDIELPDINGIRLLSIMKDIDPSLPVIMFSASIDTRDILKSLRSGAYDYLNKPYDIYELKQVLKNAVENSASKIVVRKREVPSSVRSFIDASVEEDVKKETDLANAINEFEDRYIGMITTKYTSKN
jgi:DNA-binding NtrC family response regulator